MNLIKKIFLLGVTLFLMTGCSLTKDSLEDATIYTTVYPIRYLTEFLYSDYATIESIYPNGADIPSYELTEKQLKEYAKSDLFIYNGLGNEKNIAKDMININDNLLIIDVSNGLNYTHGIEELWMSPNNCLMLAKNIRNNLLDYTTSTVLSEAINEMYKQVGKCQFDNIGNIKRGVIVRHLMLPDNIDDSKEIIKYLYNKYKDDIYISIMNQYTPLRILKYDNLNRKVSDKEYNELIDYAYDLGVRNAYVQDGETQLESFIPNFDLH